MKTHEIKDEAAQGDIYIARTSESVPEDATEVKRTDDDVLVVSHSESGHAHVIAEPGVKVFSRGDAFTQWVIATSDFTLEHRKTGPDAHAPVKFGPGTYKISGQEEYTPEGYFRVQD